MTDDGGRRIEAPRLLLGRASAIASAFLGTPTRSGWEIIAAFDDEDVRARLMKGSPEDIGELAMRAIAVSHARSNARDEGQPFGLVDDAVPVEQRTLRDFGLCAEHARQVARAAVLVRFANAMIPGTVALDRSSFETLGTLTGVTSATLYGGAVATLARSAGLPRSDFNDAIAAIRALSKRVSAFSRLATEFERAFERDRLRSGIDEESLVAIFSTPVLAMDVEAASSVARRLADLHRCIATEKP